MANSVFPTLFWAERGGMRSGNLSVCCHVYSTTLYFVLDMFYLLSKRIVTYCSTTMTSKKALG